MLGDIPLEPRFVVWRCDHCRKEIEFDVVQLAGRTVCHAPCPYCGLETSLQEPPPPRRLVLGDDPKLANTAKVPAVQSPLARPDSGKASPEISNIAPPPWLTEPAPALPAGLPEVEKPITITLPPDPPPPPQTRAPMDLRWLTDLGVVYFRQHQFGEAFLCFTRAAEQGFATAQFCLAACYLNGQGTAQDEAAALPWLQKAAAQGNTNAEFTLGLAYQQGRGVTPDPLVARQWLQLAAAHGHAEAATRITEMDFGIKPVDKPLPVTDPVNPFAAPTGLSKSGESPKLSSGNNPDKPRRDLQRLVLRGEHTKTPEGWPRTRRWRE